MSTEVPENPEEGNEVQWYEALLKDVNPAEEEGEFKPETLKKALGILIGAFEQDPERYLSAWESSRQTKTYKTEDVSMIRESKAIGILQSWAEKNPDIVQKKVIGIPRDIGK